MSKSRTRRLSYLMVPAIALALAACGTNPSSSGASSTSPSTSQSSASPGNGATPFASLDKGIASGLPGDIAKQGYVDVGTFPNYSPGQFAEKGSNELVGWNIDLAKAMSEVLGVQFRMQPTTFDALIPGVISDRYAFAMAEANITSERRKTVDFVTYLNNGLGILVPKDSDLKSNDLTNMCGLKVGTNRGASPIPLLEEASKKCQADGKAAITVETYDQIAEAILAVKSNRIPVAVGDYQPLSYAANQNLGLRLTGSSGFNKVTAGIIFPKDSNLEKPVADALNKLITDGTYKKILDKWGVGSAAVDKAEILKAN